jgi:hypothetical protein
VRIDGPLASWLAVLQAATPSTLGQAVPARVYARTVLAGAVPRFFLLNIDPRGLHPALPQLVNRLDVDGDGDVELTVRVTPDVTVSTDGAQVLGATIKIERATPALEIRDLSIDLVVRIDRALTPPDNSASAQFLVAGHDTGAQPLVRSLTLRASSVATGAADTVGFERTTAITIEADAGGAGSGGIDHPLLLRVVSRTGASTSGLAAVVPPTTAAGLPIDLPIDLGGSGAAQIAISIPDEAGAMTIGTRAAVELRRPDLHPELPAPGIRATMMSTVRSVSGGTPVLRDRVGWIAPSPVAVFLAADDLVTARRTVLETAALPTSFDVDNDPKRGSVDVPHLQFTAGSTLEWLRLRDEQPGSGARFRRLAVSVGRLPLSLGLRLETSPETALRAILSAHDGVDRVLAEPLGFAAVLLGRDAAQLPAVDAAGRPAALNPAEQTIAFDFDDVPVDHPTVLPRLLGSARALKFLRVQEKTPAPTAAHADANAGLVIDLRLGDDLRTGPSNKVGAVDRSLRAQLFGQVQPMVGEREHTRLLIRAGALPDRTIVDLKTLPAADGDPGYFGLRLWGQCRWVSALALDRSADPMTVEGHPRRIRVALPRTPDGYLDVKRDRGGLFVDTTEPVDAHVSLLDDDGLDPDGGLRRLTVEARLEKDLQVPTVDDGLEVKADAGVSARVAVTRADLSPLAVRATPQVGVQQRSEDPAAPAVLEALTARIHGVMRLRQGGDPGFVPDGDEEVTHIQLELAPNRVNRAFRVLQRERTRPDPATEFTTRDTSKMRLANLPPKLTLIHREGPPLGDDGKGPFSSRRASKTEVVLSEPSGTAVLWSEPRQRPHDGPRAGADAGIGVSWLSIDSLPRRLILTPLLDGRYAPGETRPHNFADIPDDWTRDGLMLQTSDPIAIREMLQAAWDRDHPAGSPTAWGLTYIRLLELALAPIPDGDALPAFQLWTPSRRLATSADFEKPPAVLGILVGNGLAVTLDLDKFEQRTTEASPRWDDLPGGDWKLMAELQLDAFAGEVSVGDPLGGLPPVRAAGGPGKWWVRATDAFPWFLGGGSVALGNTGGGAFHANRIFA